MSSKNTDSSDSQAFGRILREESSNYKSLVHCDWPLKHWALRFPFLINLTLTPVETPDFFGTQDGFSLSFPTNLIAIPRVVNICLHMSAICWLSYLHMPPNSYILNKKYAWLFVVSNVPNTVPGTQQRPELLKYGPTTSGIRSLFKRCQFLSPLEIHLVKLWRWRPGVRLLQAPQVIPRHPWSLTTLLYAVDKYVLNAERMFPRKGTLTPPPNKGLRFTRATPGRKGENVTRDSGMSKRGLSPEQQ